MRLRVSPSCRFKLILTAVMTVAFDPGATHVASGGADKAVRIWSAAPATTEFRITSRASSVVAFYARSFLLKNELVERIDRDTTLDSEVRLRALALLDQYAEDPNLLNERSWALVSRPGAKADDYRTALRWAEAACRLVPKAAAYLNPLGVAQYRVGLSSGSGDVGKRAQSTPPTRGAPCLQT